MNKPTLIVRQLGVQDYASVFARMQAFTEQRQADTTDEIWLVQHPPVFTQGQAGKPEHLLRHSHIPVVQSNRGGQITYHGIGQQIMYVLLDIKRRADLNVRQLVTALEQCVIDTLADYGVVSAANPDAPGVYVAGRKICSLGLKIRKGCSFHGLALNIDMDLTPFNDINPCGYAGLQMCQLADFINPADIHSPQICRQLITHFSRLLDYNATNF